MNQIQDVYNTLIREHAQNLMKYGVELPNLYCGDSYSTRTLQLIYLRQRMGELCKKDTIADFVQSFVPHIAKDQQPRHLAYMGWNMRLSGKSGNTFCGKKVPMGHYVLMDTQNPRPEFLDERLKRSGRSLATNHKELKAAYGNKCGACGVTPDLLEICHKDPSRPLDLDNAIPLCSECNNHQSNDFVMDDSGRIQALLSSRFVKKSPENVQFQVYLDLKKKFTR